MKRVLLSPMFVALPSERYGLVLSVGLHAPDGTVHSITSVNRWGDQLYLGSLGMDAVTVVAAPQHSKGQ